MTWRQQSHGRSMSDFGEGKWIVGLKKHRCEYCFGPIPKGEKHFNYRGIYSGDWQNWRMHEECFEDHSREDECEFTPGDFPMPDRVKELIKTLRAQV